MISLFWNWMKRNSFSRKIQINELPNEMLQHIFAYLPGLEDRRRLSLVCQLWNHLAFDFNYLGQIRLKIWIGCEDEESIINSLHKISRYYRNVISFFHTDLNEEEETDNILRWLERFEKHSSSVEELVCYDSSRNCLALRLVSICPRVKKLQFHLDSILNVRDDKLPVLENLEELVLPSFFPVISTFNIIRLAPNLRRLEGPNTLDMPILFQKLPLQYLQFLNHSDVFENCTEPTKLTAVDLSYRLGDQNDLEQLCKYCPLLTKLRINETKITSLRSLASLAHLKVLSFRGFDKELCLNYTAGLPSVEIVEFNYWEDLHFDNSLQRIFPKVHYLKFDCCIRAVSGKISHSFPRLRTLEISCYQSEVLSELMEGLPDLRELILRKTILSASDLPPMRLQQLTLIDSAVIVTDGMAKNLPNLQFLNLYNVESIETDKLPTNCTVRRYLRDSREDIFDVIQ